MLTPCACSRRAAGPPTSSANNDVPASARTATKPSHLTAASQAAEGPAVPPLGVKAVPSGALPSGLSTVKLKLPVQVWPSTSESVRQATV